MTCSLRKGGYSVRRMATLGAKETVSRSATVRLDQAQ
jgi:hypothetical protein